MVPMTSMKDRLRSERGAELIEFALVVPMLLLILLGIADFGFMFQRYEVLTNAAREGARVAVLPNGGSTYSAADVRMRVCSYLTTGGVPTTGCPAPTNPVISVTDTTVPLTGGATLPAKRVQVTYSHSYLFVGGIAGLFNGTFTTTFPITVVAIMRSEVGP